MESLASFSKERGEEKWMLSGTVGFTLGMFSFILRCEKSVSGTSLKRKSFF